MKRLISFIFVAGVMVPTIGIRTVSAQDRLESIERGGTYHIDGSAPMKPCLSSSDDLGVVTAQRARR